MRKIMSVVLAVVMMASTAMASVNGIWTGESVFVPGSKMYLSCTVSQEESPVDVYIALTDPNGEKFYFDGQNLVSEVTPFVRNSTLCEEYSFQLLEMTLPENLTEGDYVWEATQVAPGGNPEDGEQWTNRVTTVCSFINKGIAVYAGCLSVPILVGGTNDQFVGRVFVHSNDEKNITKLVLGVSEETAKCVKSLAVWSADGELLGEVAVAGMGNYDVPVNYPVNGATELYISVDTLGIGYNQPGEIIYGNSFSVVALAENESGLYSAALNSEFGGLGYFHVVAMSFSAELVDSYNGYRIDTNLANGMNLVGIVKITALAKDNTAANGDALKMIIRELFIGGELNGVDVSEVTLERVGGSGAVRPANLVDGRADFDCYDQTEADFIVSGDQPAYFLVRATVTGVDEGDSLQITLEQNHVSFMVSDGSEWRIGNGSAGSFLYGPVISAF